MLDINDKMRRFAKAIADGLPGREAAIAAGYAAATANQTASRLQTRADVRAAIREYKGGKADKTDDGSNTKTVMKPKYGSSLELLRDLYNNPKASDGLRLEAAKLALPYEHAKKGELGKKESEKEAARLLSRGDKPGKFQRKPAPTRRGVSLQ